MNSKFFSGGLSLGVAILLSMQAQAVEVSGQVVWEGAAPAAQQMVIPPRGGSHSTKGCGALTKVSEKLVIARDGGIANAVVWMDGPAQASAQAPAVSSAVLDQEECVFSPHVMVLALGQELTIRNSDKILHNVRIFDSQESLPSMMMHQWQKGGGKDLVWRFANPGRYVVRCGVHPWMHAWVVVFPHSQWALTDGEGRFFLKDLPAGRHTLHVWHESLGIQDRPIVVKLGDQPMAPIRFEFFRES